MERCPNCGTPGRAGTKYCTACGHQFSGEDQSATNLSDTTHSATQDGNGETDEYAAEVVAGWPSAPAPAEPFFGSGWDPRPAASTATVDDASEPDDTAEGVGMFWQETATESWPLPVPEGNAELDAGNPLPDQPREAHSDDDAAEVTLYDAESAAAVARAERLLAELRETIDSLGRGPTLDLSGVISDLEVAATPPGALAPDEVAELREALLTARERPRDVDTIVDLTKRIDAMVALIISYDRAIAAIERSLVVLRNEGDRVSG